MSRLKGGQAMSATWIACSERLPEIDVADRSRLVLGCDKYGNVRVTYMERPLPREITPSWVLTAEGHGWAPLYWCELPAAPGKEVRP